jgi:hypothetical protein
MATNTAPVKWAQRADSLYVTISLPDCTETDIKLEDKTLVFSGVSEKKKYALNLEFFKEVDADGSVWNVLPQSIQMKLMKKEKEEEFWPRLLLDKALEKTNVKVDWDRYVDEDEGGDEDFDMSALGGGQGFGGGGMPGMGGMGGMPGMGGMGGMPGMEGMGGMDMAAMMQQMQGMGGMGGMPGMPGMGGMPDMGDMGGDEGDSDDGEDLPDLESTEA